MHFFLQGDPKIGKSYLLQNTLRQYNFTTTGFTPQRLYNERNEIKGYRAELMQDNASIMQLDGVYTPNVHNMFLDFQEKYKKVDILENLIHQVRMNAILQKYDLIMLDEIGGFEMASEVFVDDLFYLLDTNSCIGVLKERTRSMVDADVLSNIEQNYDMLFSKIQQKGKVYTLQKDNRAEIDIYFNAFLSEINDKKHIK